MATQPDQPAWLEIAQYVQPDMDRITAAEKTCSRTTH
jgi:hypothetical protein